MANEFRRIGDRRIDDLGPPLGQADRRIAVERRLPEVCDFDIDEYVEIVSVGKYYDEDFPPPRYAMA
jgi:hypothetical protein